MALHAQEPSRLPRLRRRTHSVVWWGAVLGTVGTTGRGCRGTKPGEAHGASKRGTEGILRESMARCGGRSVPGPVQELHWQVPRARQHAEIRILRRGAVIVVSRMMITRGYSKPCDVHRQCTIGGGSALCHYACRGPLLAHLCEYSECPCGSARVHEVPVCFAQASRDQG